MMGGFAFVVFLTVYIGVPLAVIFLLKWTYQIKISNETQVKQNQKIIQLLEDMNDR